jgi:hypothetical protein
MSSLPSAPMASSLCTNPKASLEGKGKASTGKEMRVGICGLQLPPGTWR